MRNITQYITEAVNNIAELKKAIKKNGFSAPASFKQEAPTPNVLTYKSKGGYRGEQVIRDVVDKLKDAGWTEYDEFEKFTPDGSAFEFRSSLMSPDKSVAFMSNTNLGGTSWDNFYYAQFELTSDIEDKLTKQATFAELKPYLAELGFRYCSSDDMPDRDTFKNGGAGNKDALKKLDGWKGVGDNEWEKGNCVVRYEESGIWGDLYVSLKNPVKPIKL